MSKTNLSITVTNGRVFNVLSALSFTSHSGDFSSPICLRAEHELTDTQFRGRTWAGLANRAISRCRDSVVVEEGIEA
jgi:hypothetical protein